jgi:hypothetical protein
LGPSQPPEGVFGDTAPWPRQINPQMPSNKKKPCLQPEISRATALRPNAQTAYNIDYFEARLELSELFLILDNSKVR